MGHLEDRPSLSRWMTRSYSFLSSGTCPRLMGSGSILSLALRSQERLLGISNVPHDSHYRARLDVGWIGQLPLNFPRPFDTGMNFFLGHLNLLHKLVNPLCFGIISCQALRIADTVFLLFLCFFFLSKDVTVHLEK